MSQYWDIFLANKQSSQISLHALYQPIFNAIFLKKTEFAPGKLNLFLFDLFMFHFLKYHLKISYILEVPRVLLFTHHEKQTNDSLSRKYFKDASTHVEGTKVSASVVNM